MPELSITFDPRNRLGQGGTGSVFSGFWDNQGVAVKRVQSIDIDEKEESALKQLDHKNVVKLLHVESDNAFKYFALELCNASLDQLFLANGETPKYKGPRLPYHFVVLLQLASGLEYIHSKKLVHRDVKPENVLIHVDSVDEKVTMKWADFGLSKPVNERGTFTMSGIRGSMSWMAPELLKENSRGKNNRGHSRGTVKSDVFAEGCVFGYYLSDGIHPFGNADWQIPSNIANNTLVNLDDKIKSSYACKLIKNMVESKLQDRMTSEEVRKQIESDINELKQKEPELFKLLQEHEVNLGEVETLLHEGVDVNCVNSDGCTPLLYLAKVSRGKINLKKAMELLLKFPVDVNKKEKRGYNVLHFLCWFYQQGDLVDIVKLLIEKNVDVSLIEDNEGCNALHFLCENYRISGLIKIIQLLIDDKIDVNRNNKEGWNALQIVCRNYKNDNLIDIVRLLIEKGTNVGSSEDNEMKYNALHLLCENYRGNNITDIIELLIDNKIDVNSKNKDGWNGLHFACKHYNKEDLIKIVRLFIQRGIDVNSIDGSEGCNALHLVCENYQGSNLRKIIELLIQKEMNVKTKNKEGWNALHIVCQNYKNANLIRIVELLIESGIKVYTKTNKGWNALLILCQNYFNTNLIKIVQFLIENGIDINWKNNKRWNALHLLCKHYSSINLIDIIKLLFEHHMDVNCATNEGNAFHLVCKYYPNNNILEILRLLVDKGISVKWNGVDPRTLIRQNPNQELTKDCTELFDIILTTTSGKQKADVEDSTENMQTIATESLSNGHRCGQS